MKHLYLLIIGCCSIAFSYTNCYSFNNKTVHPKINETAALPTQSTLDTVLKGIGFQNGIIEELTGFTPTWFGSIPKKQKIYEWLQQGGKDEDAGFRSLKHFHDPTKQWQEWGEAGLWENSIGLMESSLLWAQNDQDNQASWSAARDHFYQALTQNSEQEYAAMLVALGQVMHLVSDLAVPAHVRNDAHPVAGILGKYLDLNHFEVWTSRNWLNLAYDNGINYKPDQTIFSMAVGEQPSPISALWDIDKYDMTNPTVTLEPNIGLAEYTNANFFSEDTRFSAYPFPNYPETDTSVRQETKEIEIFTGEDTVNRKYWMKNDSSDNSWYKLAGVNYNIFWTENLYIDGFKEFDYLPPLDREVFKDYATKLIPRAVG